MNQPLAGRVKNIKPSATLAITAKASKLRAQGQNIISLSAGEPDFQTPEPIKQAAITAIHNGKTHYTPVDGITPLKQAIIHKFKRDNQLHYELDQVMVSCGGKQVFYNLAMALLDIEDEVIIPSPYWVSYPDMVKLAQATPVCIKTTMENNFKLSPEQLEQAITPKTKLLVLNSPSNPSGVTYTREELEQLAEVLLKHPHVYIISDDIYELIIWNNKPFCNLVMANPKLYDRTIILNGVSKGYAMTGWRIGYAAGPKWLIAAMKTIQSQSTSNPCSISQEAAVMALEGDQSYINPMVTVFKTRHDLAIQQLKRVDSLETLEADGAFYLFPNCRQIIHKLGLKSDLELVEVLLESGVAVVPGTAFGYPDHIRLSYATSNELLLEGLKRIIQVFQG